jgi:4-alpha-glucanotransferase
MATFRFRRSGGVLLHPTSLPGGKLGTEAYRFVDWLADARQSYWQVLPLAPPDKFDSPYAGLSAFAGSGALLAKPAAPVSRRAESEFRRRHSYWIDDWAELSGTPGEVATQVRFEREWNALRAYANRRGVRIIGDLPLYVDRESVDVAAHPELFDLSLASGVPPDRFSGWGQLWGSPTYRWGALRREGYRWWIERFRRSLELVDVIRLDHFRGLVAYWAVRHGNRSAKRGRWLRGPGGALFDAVFGELGQLPLIVEDLGVITPPVRRLREEIDAPGMHILQWAFSGNPNHPEALPNHREHAVVYTGTHDNDPVAGWWKSIPRRVRARVDAACEQAGVAETDPSWRLVELALSSRSRLAIVQAQDVLGLGSEARMNLPATFGQNWQWRLETDQLTRDHAGRLREATRRWGRLPG